jgi:hypothetical protein
MDNETITTANKVEAILHTIGTLNYTGILLFVVVVVFTVFLWRLSRSANSKFFFDDLLIDTDGKASTSKLAQIVALISSTWAFLHITLQGELTEWFYGLYMGIWVMNRGYAKWVDQKVGATTITSDSAKPD